MDASTRYGAAVLCVGGAFLLRLIFEPLVGQAGFHLFAVAVTLAALGGVGPGLLATLLSSAAGYFMVHPGMRLSASGLLDDLRAPLFVVEGTAITLLVAVARWSAARALAAEQERVQQDLREAAEQRRAILDSALDAVVGTDERGRVTFWNRRATQVFGWTEPEAMGRDLAELVIRPAHREAFRQGLARVVETGEWQELGQKLELLALRRDRSHFPAEISFAARRQGKSWAFNAYVADITERKRSEEQLRRNLAFTTAITSSLGEGVLACDPSGRLTFANAAAASLLGWSEAELLERSLHDVVHAGADHAAAECPLLPSSQGGAAARLEDEFGRRDGGRFPIACTVSAIADPEPSGSVLVFYDVSGRKQAEESRRRALEAEQQARQAAEAANRMKDDFLATLSHELRTPLTAIVGWAQILRDQTLPEKDVERAIASIDRNARAQAQLISDLLDVSRIISGKLRLDLQPVSAVQVAEAALDTVRPAAVHKGVELEARIERGVGRVQADAHRMQQVLWNLLTNAVKFTPRGGRVTLRLRPQKGQAVMEVADTGEGISPEFLPHVFERFRQADASSARPHAGLGLGLAIVRHLVELHGGSVEAHSAGRGSGACFTVRLPVLAREPATAVEEVAAPLSAAEAHFLDGLHVLVVEDDADIRELVRTVLTRRGARVRVADSAASALDALRRERPDVMLSDLEMPGTDGYALMREILSLPEGGTIRAAALTGYARPEDRVQALQAGYRMHLVKPVPPDELISAVATLAGRAV